jgi:hypothetical protein
MPTILAGRDIGRQRLNSHGGRGETLYKVLCHYLVVLIHEMYELGIDSVFWGNSETTN